MLAWMHLCCELYNAALQERRGAWETSRTSVSLYDQQKALTEIRAVDAEYAAVPVWVQRSALARLDRAFGAFFTRCAAGAAPGHPRFRSARRYRSFSFPATRIRQGRVTVPRIGRVKFNQYRPLKGIPREITIGREPAGNWYVAVACDLGDAPMKVVVRTATGIDLGVTDLITLSDGSTVQNPRFRRQLEATLSKRQRVWSRRVEGSRGREKARLLVAKTHAHIRHRRQEFVRKLTKQLIERYDLIVHEDLQIANMSTHSNLCRAIHDSGWSVFLQALRCKAESAGKRVVAVDPRGTSQRCSACGAVSKKELSQRTHSCPCGITLGRDHNAALNILALGRSVVEAGQPAVEAEASQGALSMVKLGAQDGESRWP